MAVVPSPSTQIEQTRPDIAGSLMEFDIEMNMERMIALQVFPVLEVADSAGQFGRIPLKELLKTVDSQRASGAGYANMNFRFERDNWATEEHGVEIPVDDRNSAIYRDWFDVELVSARLARQSVRVNYEKRVADIMNDTTRFNDTAGTNWSNASDGTPITDVESRVQALYDKGIVANALIVTWKTFRDLRNSEQVIERVASSGAGDPSKPSDITLNMLQQVFDLPRILVAASQHNAANEGQNASLSSVWNDNHAIVARLGDPNGPVENPCVGRTFHFAEDGSVIGGLFESYRDPSRRSEIMRNRMDTDEKVMYDEAAEIITGVNP